MDWGGFKSKGRRGTGNSKMRPFLPGDILQSSRERGVGKLRSLVGKWNRIKRWFLLFPFKVRAVGVSFDCCPELSTAAEVGLDSVTRRGHDCRRGRQAPVPGWQLGWAGGWGAERGGGEAEAGGETRPSEVLFSEPPPTSHLRFPVVNLPPGHGAIVSPNLA